MVDRRSTMAYEKIKITLEVSRAKNQPNPYELTVGDHEFTDSELAELIEEGTIDVSTGRYYVESLDTEFE